MEDMVVHDTKTMSLLERKTKGYQQTVTDSKKGGTRDLKLISSAVKYLRHIQTKAFTNVLRKATEEAIDALAIDAKVEVEISMFTKKLKEHENEVRSLKRETRKLTQRLEWLNTIKKYNGVILDGEVELALSLCIANEAIKPPTLFKLTHTISEYKAFPSVCEVFETKKVDGQELVDIGEGVRVSKPVQVKRELGCGDHIFSSVSHKGVFAVSYDTSGHNYQLTDLPRGSQINIEVEDWTHTGFYDNSMVMITKRKTLRICTVDDMFTKKNVDVTKLIGDVSADPDVDVTLLHSTRVLVFASKQRILHEFNVDAEMIRELGVVERVWSLASLTGIDIGVKGVFTGKGMVRGVYHLNRNDSTSLVSDGPCSGICTLIPSVANPTSVMDSLKINHFSVFATNSTYNTSITTPFKHQQYHSVVRLHRDIFLVFDGASNEWCLVRITVP